MSATYGDFQRAEFRRLHPSAGLWDLLEAIPSCNISREWIDFIAETQKATPVIAELRHGVERLGFFTGLMVRKMGLPILGSPFPGWMASYMGFTLDPRVSRAAALLALERFAFQELGCVHVEIVDRHLDIEDVEGTGWVPSVVNSFETDLTLPEQELFRRMAATCRRCIRKAGKSGVQVEEVEAGDEHFADDYYAQLRDGLLRKGLVPSYDARLVRGLIEHLFPAGRLLLLRGRDRDGRCIASGLYPVVNSTAHLWGNVASYSSSRHLRPTEALNWYAMRYWKARGVQRFDWGGLGRYKQKYGGSPIAALRVRKSRSAAVACLRRVAERTLRLRLTMQGQLMGWWHHGSNFLLKPFYETNR